jgi:photosystem II stability/assembly factor-like uncharacterized protein
VAQFDEHLWLSDIAFDPTRPDVVYLSTFGHGVLASSDGGHSWARISDGLPSELFDGLAIDSTGRLYALAGFDGLFATRDGGFTWETLLDLDDNFHDLAIHPTNPQILQVALASGGVIRSEDGGATWFPAGSGIAGSVGTLIFDPAHPGRLWAAARNARLYRSDDGVTWVQVASLGGAFDSILDLLVDARTPGVMWAATSRGLQGSTDGGLTWEVVAFTDEVVRTVRLVEASSSWLAAGTDEGVFRSVDGTTWEKWSEGLNVAQVASLETASRSRTVYSGVAECKSGVLVSRDAGLSWSAARPVSEDPESGDAQTLAVSPDRPARALAGVGTDVFKTSDYGRTWVESPLPPEGGTRLVKDLAIDPRDPERAFVATESKLARSQDDGASWEVLLSGRPWSDFVGVAIAPSRPQWVWASGRFLGPILSRDGGDSWEVRNNGIGAVGAPIAADPFDAQTAFFGWAASGGLSRTLNGGLSWLPIGPPLPGLLVRSIAPHPQSRGVLAAAIGGRVWLGCDHGDRWIELEDAPTQVTTLAWSPGGLLLAGTERHGVFRAPANLGPATCQGP